MMSAPPLSEVDASHIRVLVIEDVVPTIVQLAGILRGAGYRLTIRPSTVRHDEIGAIAPDLIVLDPVAGDGSGGELLRQLRTDVRTASIPIVVCASAPESARRLDGDLIGPGMGLVVQPLDPGDLLAEIAHTLRQSRAAPAVAGRHAGQNVPVPA